MNTTSLPHAKRDLERAVEAVKASARNLWKNSSAQQNLCPLDYFYAQANNGAKFGKRVQELRSNQLISTTSEFDRLVEVAYANYTNVERLAQAEKTRLAAKRAAVAAKADLKKELNLQEGVKLAGVDVGQYKVILAGLEPVRLHVYEVSKKNLQAAQTRQTELLRAAVWNGEAVAEWRTREIGSSYEYTKYPEHFLHFFNRSGGYGTASVQGDRFYGPRQPSEVKQYIENKAQQFALAYVQGYAVKLAQKVGEVVANDAALTGFAPVEAWVTSKDLWANSVAYIRIEDARKTELVLTFHTQIIWNRSCLGKVFNQYPTRRV